ncbi:thiamine phosphate synthase [Staphylococcus sp. SQ8-PEA]|uniref:Thiamine phosphate synthase n=1 Tax=Staphylococcus marylandisciuri TaxID=2981529 RepID=A0ABT2QQL8_9STAP|nr:thiamine phosphate synthase [Staphylococcus marylandisciuri]MCU5746279.1 thiamine phosphate synthase [Staphylococcus marylandisciuri]
MFIAITPYRELLDQDATHYSALAPWLDGLILRTPMKREALKQWVEKLVALGYPRQKLIAHSDVSLLEVCNLQAIHFTESEENIAQFKRAHPTIQMSQSTHSSDAIQRSEACNLDFVLYGHIFPTASKPNLPPRSEEEIVRATKHQIPVLALGGISLNNIKHLPKGFSGVAAISLFEKATITDMKSLRKEWSEYV